MKEENIEDIKLKDATLEQLFDEIESRDDTVKFMVEGEYGPDEEPPDGYISLDEMVGGRAINYLRARQRPHHCHEEHVRHCLVTAWH